MAGVCIIEPLEIKTPVYFSKSESKYLKLGKVVAVGGEEWDHGKFLPPPCKVGEEWVFLTYNDEVDHITLDGKVVYCVRFGDLRFQYEKENATKS